MKSPGRSDQAGQATGGMRCRRRRHRLWPGFEVILPAQAHAEISSPSLRSGQGPHGLARFLQDEEKGAGYEAMEPFIARCSVARNPPPDTLRPVTVFLCGDVMTGRGVLSAGRQHRIREVFSGVFRRDAADLGVRMIYDNHFLTVQELIDLVAFLKRLPGSGAD